MSVDKEDYLTSRDGVEDFGEDTLAECAEKTQEEWGII
jgi:hypothetical protein